MKKIVPIALAVTLALLIPGLLAATTTDNTDFNYIANPLMVPVSPDTAIPNAMPFCRTGSTTVPSHPLIACYAPNFIRTAYNVPSTLDGSGQTIVIVDAFGSPTITGDLQHFDSVFGIPNPPSFQIICPLNCPTFSPNNFKHDEVGWAEETTLDVEWSHAIAPRANIVLAVAPTSSGNALNAVETYVIQHYPGSIISQSFGIPEQVLHANNGQLLQAHSNYQAAVSAGITVLASAGDFGASNGFTFNAPSFPSSDPLVLAIGGTQGMPYPLGLATFDNSSGGCVLGSRPGWPSSCTPTGYGGEAVWNEPWDGIATGGALSLIFSTPSYQSGLGLSSRSTPDVSYNAAVDGGVLSYYTATPTNAAHWVIFGGTSAGSPQWAGIFALANQARANANKAPLGFVNAIIYTIAHSSRYSDDFHDIQSGNNTLVGSSVTGFTAGSGYDSASGWGTPNVANLLVDLEAA